MARFFIYYPFLFIIHLHGLKQKKTATDHRSAHRNPSSSLSSKDLSNFSISTYLLFPPPLCLFLAFSHVSSLKMLSHPRANAEAKQPLKAPSRPCGGTDSVVSRPLQRSQNKQCKSDAEMQTRECFLRAGSEDLHLQLSCCAQFCCDLWAKLGRENINSDAAKDSVQCIRPVVY